MNVLQNRSLDVCWVLHVLRDVYPPPGHGVCRRQPRAVKEGTKRWKQLQYDEDKNKVAWKKCSILLNLYIYHILYCNHIYIYLYIIWCKHALTLLWPLLGKWSILTRKYFSDGLVQAPSSNLHNQYCEDPATLHPMEASSEVAKASKVDRPGAERKASMCGMDSYRMCRWKLGSMVCNG